MCAISSHLQASPQQFITFPYSLLKTLAMTTGELETDRIFFGTPSVVVYPVVTYILWITFLVIMPILLQNMLVREYFINVYTTTPPSLLYTFIGWFGCR